MAAPCHPDPFLATPGFRLKYPLMKLALQTVGRLSHGIRLGWRTGFDSGVMLEYVYQNRPQGITPLGRLIDRHFLAHPVWEGVRSRRHMLIGQLRQAVARYEQPVVFDLAAGVGSYLFALEAGEAQLVAGDFEPEAVRLGETKARRLGRTDIRFAPSDAFDRGRLATQRADIIVSSGFFDILTRNEDIRTVLANGSAITRPGARWVFTIQEHHPDLRLLKETMVDLHKQAWELVPRRAETLVEWADELGWSLETLERNQYFAVGTLLRREESLPWR